MIRSAGVLAEPVNKAEEISCPPGPTCWWISMLPAGTAAQGGARIAQSSSVTCWRGCDRLSEQGSVCLPCSRLGGLPLFGKVTYTSCKHLCPVADSSRIGLPTAMDWASPSSKAREGMPEMGRTHRGASPVAELGPVGCCLRPVCPQLGGEQWGGPFPLGMGVATPGLAEVSGIFS